MRIPFPVAVVAMSIAAVRALLFEYTVLPTIVRSRCGDFSSSVPLFGTIPARLSWNDERMITREPPAFVPEYPRPFHSDSTSEMTAWQGKHCPM